MSREYPDWISPERAAEGNRVYSGTVPLSRMKRLVPLLVSADGDATFVAAFRRDIDRRVIVDLQVEAALPLVCQASLEVYDEQVKRRCDLAVIERDSEQIELPENYEPVKTENGRLALVSLVEEELLLGLPQVPRKPGLGKVEYSTAGEASESVDSQGQDSQGQDSQGQASQGQASQEGGKTNPFAALQGMLERKKQD